MRRNLATWPLSYVGSCHWAVIQMQGSAEIMPGDFRERAASALHYQMSIIVLALVISKLTSVLQEMSDMKQKEQEVVRIAQPWCQKIACVCSGACLTKVQ